MTEFSIEDVSLFESMQKSPDIADDYLCKYIEGLKLKEGEELPPCPDKIVYVANILSVYGFGFQSPGQGVDNKFVIAKLPADYGEDTIKKVKERSKSKTVHIVDFLARNFLCVHWTEFLLIDDILTAALRCGMSFITHNCLEVKFDPFSTNDFSYAEMEIQFVNMFENNYRSSKFIVDYLLERHGKQLRNENNWSTVYGKRLCEELKARK